MSVQCPKCYKIKFPPNTNYAINPDAVCLCPPDPAVMLASLTTEELRKQIADLQSQLAASEEKRSLLLSCLQQAEDALKEEQEENREERAKRGELLDRIRVGHLNDRGNRLHGNGCEICNVLVNDPAASQAFDAMQQHIRDEATLAEHKSHLDLRGE